MVPGTKELGSALGMMYEADRMPVIGVGVPVQTPTPVDVAVMRPPEDTDTREDPDEDPGIENARVEPVPGAARVEPLQGEEAGEQDATHVYAASRSSSKRTALRAAYE